MPCGRGSEVSEVCDMVGVLGSLVWSNLHHELAEVLLAPPALGSGWGRGSDGVMHPGAHALGLLLIDWHLATSFLARSICGSLADRTA